MRDEPVHNGRKKYFYNNESRVQFLISRSTLVDVTFKLHRKHWCTQCLRVIHQILSFAQSDTDGDEYDETDSEDSSSLAFSQGLELLRASEDESSWTANVSECDRELGSNNSEL